VGDTPQPNDFETALRFLDRPDVQALFERAAQSAVTRESLTEIPLPAGLTLTQTETLLGAVNRLRAISVPLPDFDGETYWYTTPHDVMSLLRVIDHHCTSGSELDRAISDRHGRRFLVRVLVEEAIVTSRLDGADIPYDDAHELLQMDRTPANDPERVVVNSHHLLNDLPGLAENALTPELLLDLYERVAEGTVHEEFDPLELIGGPAAAMTRLEVLRQLCAIANYQQDVTAEHPAITALVLLSDIPYWKPFPRYNGAIARILFRLYATRQNYPVLGLLPISAIAASKPTRESPRASGPHFTRLARYSEVDMTGLVTAHLHAVHAAIQRLREQIERAQERDDALRDLLQSDPLLNARQRSILGRALRVPGSTFRIRYHQMTHNIAYSTARADLMQLEEKGYLRQEQEGKAFVFMAAEGLAALDF
jgi:Fic family protein